MERDRTKGHLTGKDANKYWNMLYNREDKVDFCEKSGLLNKQ